MGSYGSAGVQRVQNQIRAERTSCSPCIATPFARRHESGVGRLSQNVKVVIFPRTAQIKGSLLLLLLLFPLYLSSQTLPDPLLSYSCQKDRDTQRQRYLLAVLEGIV